MWKIKEFVDTNNRPIDAQVNDFIKENNINNNYEVVGYQRVKFIEDEVSQYATEESSIVIKYLATESE